MKITEQKLRQLIKEEIQALNEVDKNFKQTINNIKQLFRKSGIVQQQIKGKSSMKGAPHAKKGYTTFISTRKNFVDFEFAPAPEQWFKLAQKILKQNNISFIINKNNSSITIEE